MTERYYNTVQELVIAALSHVDLRVANFAFSTPGGTRL